MPWLVMVAGLVITYFLQRTASNHIDQIQQDSFAYQTRDATLRIESRLANHEQMLRGVRGLFFSTKRVEQGEFHDYIVSLRLAERFPGMQNIGFSQLVLPNVKTRPGKPASNKKAADYTFRPQGDQEVRATVLYLQKFSKSGQRNVGYDMYEEGALRSTMDKARDSDRATITGKVTLAPEDGLEEDAQGQAGFLIFLPVYRNGSSHETIEERRSSIVGWVYATFYMNDLIQGAMGENGKRIDLNILDAENETPEELIYGTGKHNASGSSTVLLNIKQPLEIFGHKWMVEYRSMPELEYTADKNRIVIIQISGILLSLLLSLLVFKLNRMRRRALDRVHDLRIAATVFESREGMFVTDDKHNILLVNRAFSKITGYSATEAVGKNPRFLGSGRQDGKFYAEMWTSINDKGTWEGEIWNKRKNGELYPEYLTITIVRSKKYNDVNYVATFSDITERKLVELALKENQARLNEAQHIARMGSWHYDFATTQITCSEELYRIFGTSAETLKQDFKAFSNRIHPDDRKAIYAWITGCMSGKKMGVLAYRCILPGGTIRHVESNGRLFLDAEGKPVHISGTTQDVTERKLMEIRLQESEERLSLATIAGEIGIWDWDIVNNKLVWDDYMFKLYGLKRGNFGGNYEAWKNSLHPDDLMRGDRAIQDAICGIRPFNMEFRVIHADGSIHHIKASAQIFRDKQGKSLRMVGVSWDISERKLLEEQLLGTLREVKTKELAKTRFLAAAGHDLRQPVSAASLFVHALKLTSPTQIQKELIDKLSSSMNTFSELLERLLDISKFDAGLVKPQIASFNLSELFSWTVNNFAQVAREKSLKLRFYFPLNRRLIVKSDMALLKSVLMNLVTNAIKFTEQGGILISARPRGNEILVQVWDTGIGIDAENVPHVFDEFYQVANPQRSRDAGLGLGLSICQRAISLLGGELKCHSKPGRGSVFEFTLPCDSAQDAIEPRIRTKSQHDFDGRALSVRGKRFVVVEDDDLVAAGMGSLLRGLGAEVQRFSNAEEALQHNDLADADFFIVDYSLGGALTGRDFLLSLQRRENKPIHAIIITGETSSEFMRSIAGIPWHVLHKPINLSKLTTLLHSLEISNSSFSRPGEPNENASLHA